MEIKITIAGRIPSKKNSKRFVQRGHQRYLVPSEAHEEWEREVLSQLHGVKPIAPPYRMECTIYPGDKRKADLTNKVESINDVLVKAGVLSDDNWFDLPEVVLKFGQVDRTNPRAEVVVKSIG